MILALFLLAATPAPEAHHPPCWLVKSYLAMYGEKVAHETAVKNGYTEAEIVATRARCKVR